MSLRCVAEALRQGTISSILSTHCSGRADRDSQEEIFSSSFAAAAYFEATNFPKDKKASALQRGTTSSVPPRLKTGAQLAAQCSIARRTLIIYLWRATYLSCNTTGATAPRSDLG